MKDPGLLQSVQPEKTGGGDRCFCWGCGGERLRNVAFYKHPQNPHRLSLQFPEPGIDLCAEGRVGGQLGLGECGAFLGLGRWGVGGGVGRAATWCLGLKAYSQVPSVVVETTRAEMFLCRCFSRRIAKAY